MKHGYTFRAFAMLVSCLIVATCAMYAQDDPNVDTPIFSPNYKPVPRSPSGIQVITSTDGWDNFDLGVDFAEPHMSTNPRNPLWWFNAFNVSNTANHHTENGHDWASSTAPFPSNSGDPVTAYDSLGNLYWMTMNGPTITGTWVVKSTNNGQTWGSAVASNAGNDKNWIAADQTMGPYANYVYGTMTNSGVGSFTRSTNQGASFTNTWTFSNQTLPGMMVCVGPNVLGGNNISGGCVYVVTNSGSSFAATYTFYCSTDGGTSFTLKSAQNFANYVGTNVNGRNSVQNFRTRPYPFIAADNSFGPYRGRLYLVYASNVPAGDGNKSDIFCRYSTDQGTSWSSPVTVNDDPNSTANYQWHPSIWCDKQTGRLYVKWLDTRNTPTSDSCEVYASYSDNGGVSFVQNQLISNRKFRINCTTCGGGGTPAYLGDYDAVASNAQGAMLVWTDFRNGTFGSYTAYFPDFAMVTSPASDTTKAIDSVNVKIKVPAVKLYTNSVKFSATISPSAPVTFSFLNGRDSLTSYPDSVTLKVRLNNVPNGNYTVTITGKGPNGTPVHRRTLALTVADAFVLVQQPNGGEQIYAQTAYPIMWGRFSVDTVKIEYSTNRGATWLLVSAGTPARPTPIKHPKLTALGLEKKTNETDVATFNWIVPNTPSPNCLIKISDKNNANVFDTSNAPFTILPTPAPVWRPQTAGITSAFYAVSVVDTSVAWAAGDSGRVYRTLDGTTWGVRTNVTNPVSSIAAISSTIALVANNAPGNARILRTQTGGLTWVQVYQDTRAGAFIDAIKMVDATNGFAIGDPVNGKWQILSTTDGGNTWRTDSSLAQAGSEFGWGNSLSWIGQNGWFGTSNSRVYRTTNNGGSWSSAATAFTNSYAVTFATPQLGIAAGNGAARSTNAGASWTNTPVQPPTSVFGAVGIPLLPPRWYLVAGSSVYKTTDQGTTFPLDYSQANVYEAIDMKVVSVGLTNWLVGYAVGDGGTITKYSELLVASDVARTAEDIPSSFSLGQNYPNPFNPTTTIRFGIPASASGITTLQVFDVLGRPVRTLVHEKLPAGAYTAKFETDGLASGVYFYRLASGGYVDTKKMMLVR